VKINVDKALNEFLASRKNKFPDVTPAQKKRWVVAIQKQIESELKDNDIFYDNVPETVVEV